MKQVCLLIYPFGANGGLFQPFPLIPTSMQVRTRLALLPNAGLLDRIFFILSIHDREKLTNVKNLTW